MRRTLLLALCCLCLAGCGVLGGSPPTPTPPPAPTATPTPAVPAVPTLDASTTDIQDAFFTNVNDLTSEIETLAGAPCTDLTSETQANPTEVQQMHGFAAALQRVSTTQPALNTDDVRSALGALNQALTQLDSALGTCGIKQP
jgi:hypothetical protein